MNETNLTGLNILSDRELLERIYLMLLKLSAKLDSPEANMNDFMMNVVANLISNRLDYDKR